MNDRCTPATARCLKKAGFRQPKFEVGQLWYKERYPGGTAAKWVLCIFSELDFITLDGGNYPEGEAVYAPTAPDILRELGQSAALLYDQDEFLPGYLNGFNGFIGFLQPHNENPAEACAEAWEAKQKS